MRGPVGSEIEITVRRIGERKALTFNIVRDIIEIKSVKSKIIDSFVRENQMYIKYLINHECLLNI